MSQTFESIKKGLNEAIEFYKSDLFNFFYIYIQKNQFY